MYTPNVPVEPLTRSARPYGLFSAVTPTRPGDPHWVNGVAWIPQDPNVYVWPNEPSDEDAKTFTGRNNTPVEHDPLTVYASYQATALAAADGEGRALADLLALEEAQVSAYWHDVLNADGTDATAGTLIDGFALAESLLDEHYRSRGIVYASPATAVKAAEKGLVKTSGTGMTTTLGTPFAVLYGTSPETGTNIYVSGDLAVFRSEATAASATTPGRNDVEALVERAYVLQYDPAHLHHVTVTEGP